MKTIARFIFSVYAIVMFMLWVLIGAFVYLIGFFWLFPQLNKLFIQFLYGVIDRLIMISTMIRTEQYFHGKYSKDQSYVVVSNHQTALDIPVNIFVRPKEIIFKFLGKSEAGKIPILGYLINQTSILVDRKDAQSRKQSYVKMKEEMSKGFSIIIYPEGTRNRSTEPVKEFYDGAFRLAIELQVPLLVNTLVGIKELNPPTGIFTFWPGKVVSHYEAPIETKGLSEKDIPSLKAQAANLMTKRLSA